MVKYCFVVRNAPRVFVCVVENKNRLLKSCHNMQRVVASPKVFQEGSKSFFLDLDFLGAGVRKNSESRPRFSSGS